MKLGDLASVRSLRKRIGGKNPEENLQTDNMKKSSQH